MWTYFDSVDRTRQALLLRAPPFDVQAIALSLSVEVEATCWEKFTEPRLRGCERATFLLRISEVQYDCFFNSPNGYRGQYAISTTVGERANRHLIDSIKGPVVSQACQRFGIDKGLARHSLEGGGAKIWIYEPDVEVHYFDDDPEIDFARWRLHSQTGAGLRAPLGTRIELKGGWLDKDRNLKIDPYKANRSSEIHMTGFS